MSSAHPWIILLVCLSCSTSFVIDHLALSKGFVSCTMCKESIHPTKYINHVLSDPCRSAVSTTSSVHIHTETKTHHSDTHQGTVYCEGWQTLFHNLPGQRLQASTRTRRPLYKGTLQNPFYKAHVSISHFFCCPLRIYDVTSLSELPNFIALSLHAITISNPVNFY